MINTRKTKLSEGELQNFEEIAEAIKPSSGDIPQLDKISIGGVTAPLNGIGGGDHIVYVNFNKRYDLDKRISDAKDENRLQVVQELENCRKKGGMLISDVSGHKITDALLAGMLHQAFLTGLRYELQQNGEVTTELFENLNSRFYNSSSFSKFITMIYGEISSTGTFKYINAGHPAPLYFSSKSILIERTVAAVKYPPMGTQPSRADIDYRRNLTRVGYKKKYEVNKIDLEHPGDMIILYTDGLLEHSDAQGNDYYPEKLEEIIRIYRKEPVKDLCKYIIEDMRDFGKIEDDVSLIIIRKEK